MLSALLFAALFQISCALSIGQVEGNENHIQARSARLQKRMDTGAKIAIGICVPVAAFTVGLGIFIFAMYPIQLRKLRAQNPNAEIGLNELMTGRIKPAPPPYNKHHESAKPSTETFDPPSYPAQPRFDASTAPTTDAQVRHAALMS